MVNSVLLIIASIGYQPLEYDNTRKELEAAGIKVVIASDKAGIAKSSANSEFANVDLTLDQVNMQNYSGVFIIGGPGALDCLDNKITYKIIQAASKNNKPFGAICISPRIIASACVLNGKNATGWDDDNKLTSVFKKYNVNYIKNHVVIDGNIVTADGPMAATDFGKAIVKLLKN